MNMKHFIEKYSPISNLNPIEAVTLREMTFPKLGIKVPVGVNVRLFFSEKQPDRVFFDYNGEILKTYSSLGHKTFKPHVRRFLKPPTLSTLENWGDDGYCKSILGQKVEPDGYDKYGAPSWLLSLNLI